MTSDGAESGLQILTKADAVVRALQVEGEMTGAQIAAAVQEPASSTYRLLQSLIGLGWVAPASRRGRFRLGLYFIRVGGALEDRLDVRHASVGPLRELRDSSSWTSFLCFRRRLRGVCVERFDGEKVRMLAMQVGDSLPLFVGAAPLALLSYAPEAELHRLLDQIQDSRDPDYPTPPRAELRARALSFRAAGHTVADQDVTAGVASVGAPVFDHRGELVASVSVSGLRSQVLSPDAGIPGQVVATAVEISSALGWTGDVRHPGHGR